MYIHVEDKASGANVAHIYVEHPDLDEIIEPSENSFVGGKNGGVFIGLKDKMVERTGSYVEEID